MMNARNFLLDNVVESPRKKGKGHQRMVSFSDEVTVSTVASDFSNTSSNSRCIATSLTNFKNKTTLVTINPNAAVISSDRNDETLGWVLQHAVGTDHLQDLGLKADRFIDLKQCNILDKQKDSMFQLLSSSDFGDFAKRAAHVFSASFAVIHLQDSGRQYFCSNYGVDVTTTLRACSFRIHHAHQHQQKQSDGLLIVGDASKDERFATHPLVTGDFQVRFYAGAALITPQGKQIGVICVVDMEPRDAESVTIKQKTVLRHLANQAMNAITEHWFMNDVMRG
jgi:hypothetical protein